MAHNHHNHDHTHDHDSHDHDHHSIGHHHHAGKNIKIAFFLNLGFTIIEIIGGIFTNSMAILSDALHDLGDSLSLGIAYFLERKSSKKPDGKFTYGYARFSLLGAVINSLVLVGGSVLVLTRAIPRIIHPEDVNVNGMLVFAILGIIINSAAMLNVKKGSSFNAKTVSFHLLEDVLGWVVVLIASIVLKFIDIPIIDPILSVAITVYILYNAIKNLLQIVNIFLQAAPDDYEVSKIEAKLLQRIDAQKVHHTHIWSLDGQKHLLSIHIVVDETLGFREIIKTKRIIREYLLSIGISHATIEIEYACEENDTCDY